ncbi:MAG: GAF domain-containing protein [Acidobacteria bacterium]|nr:GAF domain-containing protein [Acidobacteriota bacterium]
MKSIHSGSTEVLPRMSRETPAAGDSLAHYRLVEKIGEGGMGTVFKAWDTRLERTVALKIVSREIVERQDPSRARLLREARLASSLNHPHIATIYGFEEVDGRDVIVMEYVQGPTLRQRIRSGPMDVRDVLDVAAAIADALGEAHGAGVIHRDVKPENVILSARGPKVMDFGLAKLSAPEPAGGADADSGRQVTQISTAGMAVGTVAYMSPEQAVGRAVDARTDVFSFGVVLYEMLTREPAFSGDSDVDVLYEILHHAPRPIAEINPDSTADVQAIVDRCTAKDPQSRYANAREICAEIKRARISLDVQRARTLHTLFTISREMTAILALEPLLQRIAALVKSLIEYDVLGIFRVDATGEGLNWIGGSGYSPERARRTVYRADRGVCGRVLRTREPIAVGDVTRDADYYPPNGEAYLSNLAVPLIHMDRVIGVLNMESRRAHFFTSEHVTIMSTLAGPIAAAMENARLFEQSRAQALALESLHEVGREVASILDVDFLLDRIGEITRRVIDHDLFTVFLLDEKTGLFSWRIATGYDPAWVAERELRLGEGIISRAVEAREAVVVDDVSIDPDYVPPRTVDGRVPRSELAVPLVAQDRVLGVLAFESFEPGHFTPDHGRLASILASQVATAIENGQLYREIQDRARVREEEADRVRRRFESYVTPHIAEQVFRDPNGKTLAGERRVVTVLVADVRGFTSVAESVPGESIVSFLQEFFSVMTHVVFKFEGTVDKFLGDALMAFYGAPVAHDPRYGPSDAQRAVFAALDMRDAFARLRDRWWARDAAFGTLDLAVGINTGTCLLGNMGSDKRVEYTAIGGVVNLAFRLCREAAAGEIRIGGRTHADVHEDVKVQALDADASPGDPRAHVVVGLKYLS